MPQHSTCMETSLEVKIYFVGVSSLIQPCGSAFYHVGFGHRT